jgi:hypothetical protein
MNFRGVKKMTECWTNSDLNVGHVCKQADRFGDTKRTEGFQFASCCIVLRRPAGQVALKKNKNKTFLSADSRLSRENYKVFKIDHYDMVQSFEKRATLLRSETICRPYTMLRAIAWQNKVVPVLNLFGWRDSRELHNEELHNLYSSASIIRMVKSRRMRWAGRVARMGALTRSIWLRVETNGGLLWTR